MAWIALLWVSGAFAAAQLNMIGKQVKTQADSTDVLGMPPDDRVESSANGGDERLYEIEVWIRDSYGSAKLYASELPLFLERFFSRNREQVPAYYREYTWPERLPAILQDLEDQRLFRAEPNQTTVCVRFVQGR